MKHTITLLIALALFGCQNNSTGTDTLTTQNPPPKSLEGLSVSDTLKTKYAQAFLNCQANFPYEISKSGNNFGTTGKGSASLDLLDSYPATKSFTLHAQAPDLALDVQFAVDKIEVHSGIVGQEGQAVELQYSPLVSGHLEYATTEVFLQGAGLSDTGAEAFSVSEGLNDMIVDEKNSTKTGDGSSYYNLHLQISCVVATKIKPEYQGQFKQIVKK